MVDTLDDIDQSSLGLKYWQAVAAFGPPAVEKVVRDPQWADRYPETVRVLHGGTETERHEVLLPGDVVFEIAGHPECTDVYYADPDGKRLYAVERKSQDRSGPESRGHILIPNQEAMVRYGAYCLFMASEKGIGYRGEVEAQSPTQPA
jgi:hypothetical protein